MIFSLGKAIYFGCFSICILDDERISKIAMSYAATLAELFFGKSDWSIEKTILGKPYFTFRQDCYLSISHTENFIVVAVSNKYKVGIDVEIIHLVSDRIIRKYYSDKEKDVLKQSKITSITSTVIWTGKEAHSKCVGTGLVKENLYWCTLNSTRYSLHTLLVLGYVITICVERLEL